MADSKTMLFQKIEEILNLLLADPDISRKRRLAPDWIDRQLRERIGAGLSFPANKNDRELLEKAADGLGLSNRKLREFRYLLSDDVTAAVEWLQEQLLSRERITFRKKAGIPAATWKRFYDASSYVGDETVKRIIEGLELDEAGAAEFRTLVIREVFQITKCLRDEISNRLKESGESITDFCSRSFISQNAWEPFRKKWEEGLTSQGTLLKLVIGFRLSRRAGEDFLALVGSGFVMRRDLVVLACMLCGIYDVYTLHDVLDFFAEGYGGERLYGNLYQNID